MFVWVRPNHFTWQANFEKKDENIKINQVISIIELSNFRMILPISRWYVTKVSTIDRYIDSFIFI